MSTASQTSTTLYSRSRRVEDGRDPVGTWEPGDGGFVFLHDRSGLAASGVAARVPVGTGPNRITEAAERVTELLAGIVTDNTVGVPGTGPLAVGALPFGDDQPGELIVPAVVYGRNSRGQAWVTETGPDDGTGVPIPGPAPILAARPERDEQRADTTPVVDDDLVVNGADRREAWTATVRRALGLITAGAVTKVVLARQLEVTSARPFDVGAILARLRSTHRSSWIYAAGDFVGASPELLVRRRRDWVESTPMAGTAPQGFGRSEDDRLVEQLASSGKDLAEHSLVVDEVLAKLDPVCREVFAHAEPQIVRLNTVSHLATNVAGWLREPPLSALSLAGRLHPTPAVAGIPLDAALAVISEMEGFERGLYAGPVGWVDARGDGDWVVALRGAELRGNTATVTAGAGIVSDSDADAEWRETEAKLATMLEVLACR